MKQKKLFSLVLGLCAAVCLSIPVWAAPSLQPTDTFYVYDGAQVLSDSTENDILAKNATLYSASGAQIVVVTVNDTEGYSCEEYAYELANSWGIGDATKNNGVLLLLDIEGQDYQCIQGRGLENYLPTTTLSRILRKELEPDFAAGTYDAGVAKTFEALYGEVAAIYGVTSGQGSANVIVPSPVSPGEAQPPYYEEEYSSDGTGFLGMIVFLVIVLVVISSISGAVRPRRYSTTNGMGAALPFLMGLNYRPYRRSYFHSPYRHRTPPPPPRPYNPSDFNGGFSGSGLFGGGGGFGTGGSGRSSGGFGGGFGGGGRSSGGGGSFRGGGAGRGH